ncbi:MAG: hypothetical protein IT577_07615 [Verrucomicrobiae bacterium]|nr:hypothetical protein [Verrucomicrobiae bacterium]
MASRSRRGGGGRRRKKGGVFARVAAIALLAAIAAIAWLALRSQEPPSVEDQVMEMIRENPAAEVLAPAPGGAASEASPEVFRIDEPRPGSKKSKR